MAKLKPSIEVDIKAAEPSVASVLSNPSLVRHVLDHVHWDTSQPTARSFRACCRGARTAWDQQRIHLHCRDRDGFDPEEVAELVRRFLRRGGRPSRLVICDLNDKGNNSAALPQRVLQAFVDVAAEQPGTAWPTTDLSLQASCFTPAVGRTAAAALPALSQLTLHSGQDSINDWAVAVQGLVALLTAAPQLQKLCIPGLGNAQPLPPPLLSSLAACSSLRYLHLEWGSAHVELLRQLGSLTQLQRLRVGRIPLQMVSELRPLTQLTKLEVFNPTGVASATDCACLPALRNLDLDSGLLDARGLEALTRLTSLAVGLLLGPEHIAALSGDADGWAFGEELLATDAGLPVVLPPLELPLPVYRLPPQLVQLRFYAAAQFVEVLGALQVPPSLKRVMALDGNEAIDHLQLPLLQGRHTTAVVEGGAPDQGPRLLPAAAQAMQRFAQQLGSRWHGCRDVRPIYVAPPTPEWQPVQGAPVLLPPPPGWNLPPGPRGRGLQQAPGSHGAWVSALAAMPGLRGLWLQGLALTSADLRAIGTAFTSIRTLSLVGLNPRCCPYPALLALGPLLPRLHKLRVAGDALLISPDDEDAEEQVRAAAMRGAVAATLASLCHFGGATLPDTNSNSTNTSSNSTNTNTHSGSSGSLGFSGTVQLVCACGRAQDHVLDGVAALHLRDGVIEALQELEVLAPAAMGEELAAGLEVDVEHVDRAARACDDSGPAQPLGHEWAD